MTIEEKRQAIGTYCVSAECDSCPLNPIIRESGENCFSESENPNVDAKIERNYAILFGDSEPVTDTTATTDAVNHPKHYGREGAMECIDEMVLVFGAEATMHFCLLNAWKYRYRAGAKGGEEDLQKSDWYLAKYAELKGGECL